MAEHPRNTGHGKREPLVTLTKGKKDPKAKSGLAGKIKTNVKAKKSSLGSIMEQIKKSQGRGRR